MGRRKKRLPPDPVEVEIEDLSHDGRGVARVDGKAVFIHGALPGERVRFRYRSRRKDFDQGETVEVLSAAPQRVSPRCQYFGTCGGCVLQHLDGEAQLQAKQRTLEQNLRHIGRLTPQAWRPPLSGERWGYRRKARLSVRHVPGKGRVLVGFRERMGRFVTDMHHCEVLVPEVGQRLDDLSELVGSLDVRDHVPQIEVAAGDDRTVLVIRHMQPLTGADRERLEAFAEESGLAVFLQSGGPDSVVPISGSDQLTFELPEHDLSLHFTPVNFVQVNADMNRRLITAALEAFQPQPGERVLDLYCGLGNFTLPLARHCREAVGVEGSQELVDLARRNAADNGLENAAFHVADLAEPPGDAAWLAGGFDLVLLDPPRSGACEVLTSVAGLEPRRIVYISCHPGSLARDAGLLEREHGYRLRQAGVVDMFPHTAHVESIAVFEPDHGR